MHLFDPERRFMGGYGIVGGNLPLAAGVALASDYRGEDAVTLCMFGDGASNQGTFGETMNLAALWKLPVVFLVVNNQYGMGTALVAPLGRDRPLQKAECLGVPGERVDGMDVLAVRECVAEHLRLAREERQPTLVEALTYRFRGHSAADPEVYRTKEEVQQWRERDPILLYAERARRRPAASTTRASRSATGARSRSSTRPSQFAEQSPEPALESLYDNVYVLGDQVQGWYSVDERTPDVHRGEDEREVGSARRRARAGRGRRGLRGRRGRAEAPPRSEDEARIRPADEAPGGRRGLMATMRYREALNQAMREEMEARRVRLPDGRGRRRLPGRVQGHRGAAGGVRREARARHADLREHDRRHGRRRRDGRPAPDRRDHDRQLRAARDGPDHQLGGAHPLHVRRPGEGADGGALPAGRRPSARARRTRTRSRRCSCTCRDCWSPCPRRRPTPRAC